MLDINDNNKVINIAFKTIFFEIIIVRIL